MRRVAVFGGGYVGLVTACALADVGNNVTVIEKDDDKVHRLSKGEMPFFEPGVADLLRRGIRSGQLAFTNNLNPEGKFEVIMICVGTPSAPDGSVDLSHVFAVGETLCKSKLDDSGLVVLKSTCPPGTSLKLQAVLKEAGRGFEVAFNPEFLRQGSALDDTLRPERIVLGVQTSRAEKILTELFKPFVRNGNPIVVTDPTTAELVKYVANCYLATRISFINEVANLCERLGGDINALRVAVGLDSRIGTKYFYPGIGYGGSCFPKDVAGLINFSRKVGYQFRLAEACAQVNAEQRQIIASKVLEFYGDNVKGKTFAVWGLSFKHSTDDVRETPAYYTMRQLADHGARFQAFDPEANLKFQQSYPDVAKFTHFFDNQYAALQGANSVLVLNDWNTFKNPDFSKLAEALSDKLVFDGRNLYDSEVLKQYGLTHVRIGKSATKRLG